MYRYGSLTLKSIARRASPNRPNQCNQPIDHRTNGHVGGGHAEAAAAMPGDRSAAQRSSATVAHGRPHGRPRSRPHAAAAGASRPLPRRLCALLSHLRPCRTEQLGGGPAAAEDAAGELPLLSWETIARHNMKLDAWVVVDGTVYDITDFIKDESGHPGGAEIPLEYAGKDATEFWMDMHGHLQEDILADIAHGEVHKLADTGLEALPRVVGVADGPAPAASRGPLFPSTNWVGDNNPRAGNVVWRASQVASPETLEELQSLVARASAAGTTVRCVGRSHSFTPVCDTDGLLISLAKMQRVLAFDADKGLLTVEGGATYTAVNAFLAGTAWAVPNLATLPHFTVAGSMSMGTHGSSGVGEDGRATLGNQASQVEALEFVTADGSLQRYTQGDEHFEGTLVSLGCLGAVSRLTLRLVPSFFVQQAVYINATVEDVISHFRDMISSVDSFSWLVDWPGQEDSESEALGNLDPEDEGIRGRNRLLVRNFVPAPLLATFPADAWGGQLFDAPKQQGPTVMSDVPTVGPWYELLNTYGTGLPSGAGVEENTDAYGSGGSYDTREVQVEYFVPLEQAEEALRICHEVCRHWSYDVFLITELRVTRGDELWLSPVRDRDSLVIHFSMNKMNIPGVMAACEELEAALSLAGLEPRPHWGKLHHMGGPALEQNYGQDACGKFRELCLTHDPNGVFRNEWCERLMFGSSEDHKDLVLPTA